MDNFRRLSPPEQVVFVGAIVALIVSFLDWQQVCVSVVNACAGASEWNGVGTIAALLVVVLLGWEVARLLGKDPELGSVTPGQVSAVLAALVLVFTLITFISHNEARHWPAWIGLLAAIVIAVAAFVRARNEGVEMPTKETFSTSPAAGTDTSAAPDPPEAPPAETQ
jgi:hypothetical protein